MTVGPAVGLQPLEDQLGVVEDGRRWRELQWPVGFNARVVPAAPLAVALGEHTVGEVETEAEVLRRRLASLARFKGDELNVHGLLLCVGSRGLVWDVTCLLYHI